MSSINIKDLELINNVNKDDFLLVEQYNGTKKIKARYFGNIDNQEVVDARGEKNNLKERLEEFDIKLSEVTNYNIYPQGTTPEKQGDTENSNKIVHKTGANTFHIVQQANKGYIKHLFTDTYGTVANESNYGENNELLRLVKSHYVLDAYLYYDISTPTSGELVEVYQPSILSVVEQTIFNIRGGDYAENETFSTQSDKKGIGGYSLNNGRSVEYEIKSGTKGEGNIVLFSKADTSNNIEIYVNNELVKTVNSRTKFKSKNGTLVIDYQTPISYQEETYVLKVVNKDTNPAILCCINFYRLKDFNGQGEINNYKYWGSGSRASWIDDRGANEYALCNENGKWFGSYHGGEKSILKEISWNSSKCFDNTRIIPVSDIPINQWSVYKDFRLYQVTNLIDRATMSSTYNLNTNGTININCSYESKDLKLKAFYTALNCTKPNFSKLYKPQYFILPNADGKKYYLNVTEGYISQVSDTDRLQLDIRFTKFNDSKIKDGAYMLNSTGYRKFYYGVINSPSEPQIINNVSFSKSIDFIVR